MPLLSAISSTVTLVLFAGIDKDRVLIKLSSRRPRSSRQPHAGCDVISGCKGILLHRLFPAADFALFMFSISVARMFLPKFATFNGKKATLPSTYLDDCYYCYDVNVA